MLIPSKLNRPSRLHHTLLRPRLLALLDQAGHYPLILLHCPAGYGKTTLAAQWTADHEHLGWYSLDESDNDPQRFGHYLIAALAQATGGSCPKTLAMAEKRQFSKLNTLFGQLFEELAGWHTPTLLVLDDYHLLREEQIHEGLRFFLRHMPESFSLLVVSRTQPPLGIANLRVREQLFEIDSRQLAFNHQETGQFFQQRLTLPLAEADTAQLCDDVEGWATALQLIALSSRQGHLEPRQSARRLAGLNQAHLRDYLEEEVLDKVEPATLDFLLRCSVLRSLNAELANRLTAREDGQSVLENLERQGLFTQRLDAEGVWFRFHPLFTQFLVHQREREQPGLGPQLHGLAARAWLEQGFPVEALYHCLAANDPAQLQQLLLAQGWSLFHGGELRLLEQSLGQLPEACLLRSPDLVLLRAWLAQSRHRYPEVELQLGRAERAMATEGLPLAPGDRAEFQALRAQVAINAGQPHQALALAEEALARLPADRSHSRVVATTVTGEVYHCLGQLTRALPVMQQCEAMARRYGIYHQALWALLQQSEILLAQGYLQAAFEIQDRAFELVQEQHLGQIPLHEFLLYLRSRVLWSWHRLDEAESAARRGLEVLEDLSPQRQLKCKTMLVKISLVRGDLDNARVHLQHCEQLLQEDHFHMDWVASVDQTRLLLWQLTGDEAALRRWLAGARTPEGDANHFQQAQWRNLARAQMLAGDPDTALAILGQRSDSARRLQLVSDLNRNLILQAHLHLRRGEPCPARQCLLEALTLANRTGFVSHFILEGEALGQLLRQLVQEHALDELSLHRAQRLLKELNQHQHRHRSAHFDEALVEKLLTHPQVPELVRTSPLTQREWQVLGLIYAGYSNEQIAAELDVAATTIKTHIRNLYQKLGINHRQEAIAQAKSLLTLMGY
ncbi:transcriptional regulator MalT [Zobellella denitrificans]|uniref:HTH-type transcriptional regulator MalT n=1 Tax=Zobellella denitrificans TaxID=347534 RepID=A0A291HPQ6_9GAMM|nr:HTH-type transcriptional regulator MalT [Zobellella denitrificans]ATG74196.1 transcriptional regulator MalT [Zobellella denitrificans]